MNDRALSLLGLMYKAKKLTYGIDTVKKSIKESNCKLLILTSDISSNSEKEILRESENVNVKKIKYTKDDICSAIGKYSAILCITDEGFAKKFISLIDEME